MANDRWCRYYNGVGNSPTCEKGIAYESVRTTDDTGRARWPCYDPVVRSCCGSFKGYTPEEIAADEAQVEMFLVKLRALDARETEDCIQCGARVERMEQVGRSVYARPCGCRLWQGRVPDAWKEQA